MSQVTWSPGGCVAKLLVYVLVIVVAGGALTMRLSESGAGPEPVRSGSTVEPENVRSMSGSEPVPELSPVPTIAPVPTITPVPADVAVGQLETALDAIISVAARFILAGGAVGLGVAAVVLPLRFALSSHLVNDVLALVQSFTGHWAPEREPVAPPVQGKSADLERLAELEELTDFCRGALLADSFCYGQLRSAGWSGGADRWKSLVARVAADGFAIKVSSNGGQGWSWVPKGKRGILDALAHYSGELMTVGLP